MPDASRPVFLAPHYDDVALSCGGTVAALARDGRRPLIVTALGAAPPGDLSDFARFQHERWGFGAADAVAARRDEERCAAAALGAHTRWLDFPDAVYRGARYSSDDDLFGPLHPDDARLPAQLADALMGLLDEEGAGHARLFVPLGLGNHVDHQIALEAGRLLARAGHEVWCYEDFSYAGDPRHRDTLLARARQVSGEPPDLRLLAPADLERRIAAILCYRSQLPVIFRFQGDPAESTRRYALATGDGRPAERFWRLRRAT